mmetsp:Transcript_78700/g.156491  ORF Transcript_78700/g.156491 Transcript_78700/m.156491 type:complete len:174 (-) Transcript_78700:677-1198(-)
MLPARLIRSGSHLQHFLVCRISASCESEIHTPQGRVRMFRPPAHLLGSCVPPPPCRLGTSRTDLIQPDLVLHRQGTRAVALHVVGRDSQHVACVEVEGHLHLRHTLRAGDDTIEVELADDLALPQALVISDDNDDVDRLLVILRRRHHHLLVRGRQRALRHHRIEVATHDLQA